MKQICIINGPNLNLLGKREVELYGEESFESYLRKLKAKYADVSIDYYQSNHEGDLIDKIQACGFTCDGIVINAGGYTHTSIAIRDAIAAVPAPAIEVHITDISQREPFRRHSYLTDVCCESVIGKGLAGYDIAIDRLVRMC